MTCKEFDDPRPFTARKYSIYKYFRQYQAWSTQVSEYPREYLST